MRKKMPAEVLAAAISLGRHDGRSLSKRVLAATRFYDRVSFTSQRLRKRGGFKEGMLDLPQSHVATFSVIRASNARIHFDVECREGAFKPSWMSSRFDRYVTRGALTCSLLRPLQEHGLTSSMLELHRLLSSNANQI